MTDIILFVGGITAFILVLEAITHSREDKARRQKEEPGTMST